MNLALIPCSSVYGCPPHVAFRLRPGTTHCRTTTTTTIRGRSQGHADAATDGSEGREGTVGPAVEEVVDPRDGASDDDDAAGTDTEEKPYVPVCSSCGSPSHKTKAKKTCPFNERHVDDAPECQRLAAIDERPAARGGS